MLCVRCCNDSNYEDLTADRKPSDSTPGFDLPLDQAFSPGAPAVVLRDVESPADEPPPADVPPQPAVVDIVHLVEPTEFEVTVNKDGRKLGIDVNHYDCVTLLVTKVMPGPVDDYNKANPGQELACFDRISSVNGVTGSPANMIEQVKSAEQLRMTVRQPPEMLVTISDRGSAPASLADIKFVAIDTMSLMVTEVPDTLSVVPPLEIHDRIVATQDVRYDSARLAAELKNGKLPITVTIRRAQM